MDPRGFEEQQWDDTQWQAEGQAQGNPTPQPDQQSQGPAMAQPTWADFAQLVQGFTSMGQALRQSQELNTQSVHAMHPMHFVVHAQPAVPTTDPRSAPHFRKPRTFKGKAADVQKFLQDVCDAVQLLRMQLPLKQDRCVYLASFLEDGSPKQWYTYIVKSEAHLLQDFDAFCDAFEAHFGNPNVAGDANDKLLTLIQTGSAVAHASRYTELLIHVDWSEQTKINNFYHSLKTVVKDTIILTWLQDCPRIFKKYIDFVIEIDNCMHCRKQEHKLKAKANTTKSTTLRSQHLTMTLTTSTSTRTPAASTSSPPLPQGIPMEIDTMRTLKPRGPLTNEEKEHCRHLRLCSYCGGVGHLATMCPNMTVPWAGHIYPLFPLSPFRLLSMLPLLISFPLTISLSPLSFLFQIVLRF
ncbi:hypothetical protein DXG03_008545 [Asterophora parasitica]|uniref:CCHC-type domain-containing protein n=1 Tax=Asterophora parasitica TaxID=117018 RepID=A0A9P7FXQ8_9AGAR|nr:hypothetical protein DXG03_008545 [Asterophora parasitica]